jgi:hypothetical protein
VKTLRSIRVHLDTSDYSAMYRAAPGTIAGNVRYKLNKLVQSGQIKIGLSYHVVFELLKKANPEFRENRVARARLLRELCGQNAFPYPTDLGRGHRFSTDGLWLPQIDLDEVEVERVVREVMTVAERHPSASGHERRVLSRRKYFAVWVSENPERAKQLVQEMWPLKFAHAFVESGNFNRYILGKMSRRDANKELRYYVTDPVSLYEIWFERYGRDDPIIDRRDQIASMFVEMGGGFRAMLEQGADIQTKIKRALGATGDEAISSAGRERFGKLNEEVKRFRAEMLSPEDLYQRVPIWREYFDDESALVAAQILHAFLRENRPIKPSDGIDFVHAIYLPHTELWRGDRGFSDLIIKHAVNFSERVVPTLAELPERIDGRLKTL